MSAFRKYPLFASALTLCALLFLAGGGLIYERRAAAQASARQLLQQQADLNLMAGLNPAPTREVATAIEADLARAHRALAAMQAELKGRGPAAERMQQAKIPVARTDAYFDLATFVERTRELARKNNVDIRPEAMRFGFAAYANEGPDFERIEPVFHQRQVTQYLVESLIEAHPRALVAVKREPPLTRKQREDRAAAAAALASGSPPPESTPESVPATEDGPDFFALDPRISVRAPGFLDSTAFRVVFIGQTAVLRTFLNRLASFELPVLVREVEVEVVSADEATAQSAAEELAAEAAASPAASVVLTLDPPAPARNAKGGSAPVARAATSTPAPIVAKPYSKFTVTVEYIQLVPPPSAPAEPKPGE